MEIRTPRDAADHRWIYAPILACAVVYLLSIPAMRIAYSPMQIALLVGAGCALCVMVPYPVIGGWLTLLSWGVGVFPASVAILPEGYFAACLLAVGILGYRDLGQGASASIVIGLISFMSRVMAADGWPSMTGVGRPSSRTVSDGLLLDLLFPLSLLSLATLLGYVIRQEHDREMMRRHARERRTRIAVTRNLHDHVANDITDAMLIIRHHMQSSQVLDADLENALYALAQANGGIRLLIDRLDRTVDASSEVGVEGRQPLADRLRDDADIVELVTGLVRESFGNIAGHANPSFGYVLSVEATPARYVIRVTDVPLGHERPDIVHAHSGLARYAGELERRGGTLHVSQEDGRWSMEAVVVR